MEAAAANGTIRKFIDLVQQSRRGKFKVYIGMSAGVGKTYRMLQEAHALLKNGIGLRIGYVETHGRPETQALLEGLTVIPRRRIFYRGKSLEEMDLAAILQQHPEVVIVDELAHTNTAGSKNAKRWQDVYDLLEAGISVISAVNIQHLESLNQEIAVITGVQVTERIPDSLLAAADEMVNIDLTAEELIDRLKAGKIYDQAKVNTALGHFFQPERILQLRELALREVARYVERKISLEVPLQGRFRRERFLACISSNPVTARNVIRKTARLAAFYHAEWFVIYVQHTREGGSRIPLDRQRHLLNNLKLAIELGGAVIRIKSDHLTRTLTEVALEKEITTICMGRPHLTLFRFIRKMAGFNQLLKEMAGAAADLIILSL